METLISEMKWTREPVNYSILPGRIEITTEPHTDLWQRTYYHFRNDNAPLLQMETVEMMMDEQRGKGGITARTPYGLCVHHETTLLDGKTLYGHQGMSDGILCSLYYDPETRFVFVLCSNGCNNQMENRVAHLTRKVFEAAWKAFGEKEKKG